MYMYYNQINKCFVVRFSAKFLSRRCNMLHCNHWHLMAKLGIAIGCGNEPRNGGYAGAALMFVAVSQGFSIYA